MRISDWSSDVCSSDLASAAGQRMAAPFRAGWNGAAADGGAGAASGQGAAGEAASGAATAQTQEQPAWRSEEHTSELQSLMRNSYAVFCLKKKNARKNKTLIVIRSAADLKYEGRSSHYQ